MSSTLAELGLFHRDMQDLWRNIVVTDAVDLWGILPCFCMLETLFFRRKTTP